MVIFPPEILVSPTPRSVQMRWMLNQQSRYSHKSSNLRLMQPSEMQSLPLLPNKQPRIHVALGMSNLIQPLPLLPHKRPRRHPALGMSNLIRRANPLPAHSRVVSRLMLRQMSGSSKRSNSAPTKKRLAFTRSTLRTSHCHPLLRALLKKSIPK